MCVWLCVYALEESINAIHMRSATELHVFPPEVGVLQLVSVQRSRDIDVFSADADHLPTESQVLSWKKVELFKKVDIIPWYPMYFANNIKQPGSDLVSARDKRAHKGERDKMA